MTRQQLDQNLIERVCCRNQEAMDFLANHWSPYVHAIDDIEDGELTTSDGRLATFARAAMLYTHPFFLKHAERLREVVLLVTGLYAQAVKWEQSTVAWQKEWADHNRHAGMEMVIAVARICAGPVHGYEHGERMRQEQLAICYHDHHTLEGEPI